jgi:hypothetical protein
LITQIAGAVTDWNEEAIEKRQKWMAELAPVAWPMRG